MLRIFIAAVACAVLGAGAASAADVTLRFASINQPATRTFQEQLVPLKNAIEKESKGKVAVDLRGLGQFGRPAELFTLVEKGEIEMAATVQGYSPGRFPQSSVMELPLLYETAEAGTYAMWKLYEEGLLAKDYESVKVLSVYTLPPYAIMTSNIDVNSVRDLRGLRLRSPSLTVGFAMNRLGMIPLGLSLDHIGPSLTANLIDGMTYGLDSATTTIGDGKPLLEQVKVVVDAKFAAPALMIVMNKTAYEKLSADVRTIIDRATGFEFSVATAAARDKWEAEALEAMKAKGQHTLRTLTPEQRKEIATRVAPVADEWTASMQRQGYDGAKILNRARELIRERSGKPT
jgi:TRAP-type C4-dicarboxylate transport system substrate-binding protein